MKIMKNILISTLLLAISLPIEATVPEDWNESKVFILPEDGRNPWVQAINNAEKTIDMAAYKISDFKIIDALKKAFERGVKINLLMEPYTFKHHKSQNVESPLAALKKIASVYQLSKRFNQCHYKMIVVDREWGMISTGNLDEESFDGIEEKDVKAARDFAVPILDQNTIDEILKIFEADIKDIRVSIDESSLVWGPDNQRNTFLKLLNGAQKSIDIYQQSFQDVGLAEATAAAAKAGVKVRVLMMPFPFGNKEDPNIPNQNLMKIAGARIGLLDKLYVHAKVVIVDDSIMYVGSGNFYTPSLDQTRELGILTQNLEQIQTVKKVFEKDWRKSVINLSRNP